MWRRASFDSEYITIDRDGFRRTWKRSGPDESPPDMIFVFGGSTVWGTGARNDYTIPSLMAKQFAQENLNVHVVNYGESAYCFAQEIIHLVTLLQEGRRPRAVIFYDGVNDVSNAYQDGRAETVSQHETMKGADGVERADTAA